MEEHDMQTGNNQPKPSGNRWVKVVYVGYGVFLLLLWGLRGLKNTYHIHFLEPYEAILAYLNATTCTYLYPPLINLVIIFGLLARKRWARYGVIASMLTLPVTLSLLFMVWGTLFSTRQIALQICLMLAILAFFIKFPLPQHRGTTFRLRSFTGILVVIVALMSIWPLYPSLKIKYQSREPLFIKKGESIVIDPDEYAGQHEGQRKLYVPGASLYIPFGYRLVNVNVTDDGSWNMMMLNEPEKGGGLITIGHDEILGGLVDSSTFKRDGLTNALAIERFIHTHNWNPPAIMFRFLMKPRGSVYSEVTSSGLSGTFLSRRNLQEFKLFNHDGSLLLGGSVASDDSSKEEDTVNSLIASVTPETDTPAASQFYEQGLALHDKGEFVDAQFAFTQAYLLRPDDAEYAFMLVRSLLVTREKHYKFLADILERSLELTPTHEKTKALLEEVRRLEREEDDAKSPPE